MKEDEIVSYTELTTWLDTTQDDSEFRMCAELLVRAINDWPTTDLTDIAEFLAALKDEMNKPLTLENLNAYLNKLEFKTEGDSWKMESIASLLEMFNAHLSDRTITLETILHNLTQHCRK